MKAQSEIVGITIVMVLIMLGIVFVIRFVVLSDDVNIKGVFDKTQTASNFIDTMLKTTSGCDRLRMTELIYNCINNYDMEINQRLCSSDSICTQPGGCRSCDYLNKTIGYLLNSSLNNINARYDFFICEWDDISAEPQCKTYDMANPGEVELSSKLITYFNHQSCLLNPGRGYETKQSPLPTSSGTGNLVVVIYLC
jgi:hypothetical protein